jgi:hypothetical protein
VKAGDVLVPSGKNDGTGIAVSKNAIGLEQAMLIVGMALESAQGEGENRFSVLVGQPRDAVWANLVAKRDTQLADLKARLERLEQMIQDRPYLTTASTEPVR